MLCWFDGSIEALYGWLYHLGVKKKPREKYFLKVAKKQQNLCILASPKKRITSVWNFY